LDNLVVTYLFGPPRITL